VNVVATRQSTDVAPPYWVSKGYFANTYDTAVEGASDSSNTPFQRVVFGALATAEAPLMLAEETVRGVVNVSAQATIAFQAFRAASATPDSYQRWSDIAQGLGAGGQAILGAIPVVGRRAHTRPPWTSLLTAICYRKMPAGFHDQEDPLI
jgi:hypothetical protein